MMANQLCARSEKQLTFVAHTIDSVEGSTGGFASLLSALGVVVDDLDEMPVSDAISTIQHLEHGVKVTSVCRSLNRSGTNREAEPGCAAAENSFDSLPGDVGPYVASFVDSRERASAMPKVNCTSIWILSSHHVDAPSGRGPTQVNGSDDAFCFYQKGVSVKLLRIIHQLSFLACFIQAYHCPLTPASKVAHGAVRTTLANVKPPLNRRTRLREDA